jgi:hypothetical protein
MVISTQQQQQQQQHQHQHSRDTITQILALAQLREMSQHGTTLSPGLGNTNPTALQALLASTLNTSSPNPIQISQNSQLMAAMEFLSNANAATANSPTISPGLAQVTLQQQLQQHYNRSSTNSLGANTSNPSNTVPNDLIHALLNTGRGLNAYAAFPSFTTGASSSNWDSSVSSNHLSDTNGPANVRLREESSVSRASNLTTHTSDHLTQGYSPLTAGALQDALLRQSLGARDSNGPRGPGAGHSQATLTSEIPAPTTMEAVERQRQLLLVQLLLALLQGNSSQASP